jgi:hypothetical protein
MASQAQRMVAANAAPQEARALALLAADIGQNKLGLSPTAVVDAQNTAAVDSSPSPTPNQPVDTLAVGEAIQTATAIRPTSTPTPQPAGTLTPLPTFTRRPTSAAIPTISAPFTSTGRQSVCDNSIQPGLLAIQVNGADGKPLAGVRIQITWQDGDSTFYTGLDPEINPGYADFVMAPNIKYHVRVGDASLLLDEVTMQANCAWKLEFTQQRNQ